ncbi:hypothetical protein SDC9_178023 [bioreactor metagenome]|uniref:Uncharacterized protein n=1 Tax=bioreactor metagenome TaxID=1076179 RepID=A0A645GWY5_9ZZZZ
MAGAVLGSRPVTAGVLDDHVPTQVGDVHPGTGRVVEDVPGCGDAVPDGQRDRICICADAAGRAVDDRIRDRAAARRRVVPPAVARQVELDGPVRGGIGDRGEGQHGDRRGGDDGGQHPCGNRVHLGPSPGVPDRRTAASELDPVEGRAGPIREDTLQLQVSLRIAARRCERQPPSRHRRQESTSREISVRLPVGSSVGG